MNKHRLKISIYIIFFIIISLNFNYEKTFAETKDITQSFETISIEDGLSQSTASYIFQDSRGYIWIGTSDGVNKYNGHRFEVYRQQANSKNGISGNKINKIQEDYSGNIWISTSGGISKIDKENKVSNYYLPVLSQNIDILIDNNGDVLISINSEIRKYDKEKDEFISVYDLNNLDNLGSDNLIVCLEEDYEGNYWVGTENGLITINKKTNKIERYNSNEENKDLTSHHITNLYVDELGYLWIGTFYRGINKLDLKTGNVEKFFSADEEGDLLSSAVRQVLRDSSGRVWLATERGFCKLDEETNTFITYRANKYNNNSIINDDTLSICEDSTGTIWIGTKKGINLFKPNYSFKNYRSNPLDNNSLSDDSISGIYEDNDGYLWVGTMNNGVNIIDRNNNKVTRIDYAPNYEGNKIREITGSGNEIWIATQNGLNKYNKADKSMKLYTKEDGLLSNDIKAIHLDRDGILWVSTINGLCTIDKNNLCTSYNELLIKNGIENNSILDIYEDEKGYIWLSFKGNIKLVRYNKETGEVRKYKNIKGIEESDNIITINSDSKNIWLGTNAGLIKLNSETEKSVEYTTIDGLSNDFIYGIVFDNYGHIWLSSNDGISRLNIETLKFENFVASDGLQGSEFNQYSYYKSKKGEIFFGGINGLNSFFPNEIQKKSYDVDITVEKITTNYGVLNIDDNIILNHKNNQIQFEFFIPEFTDIKKIKYIYKLSEVDKEWISLEYGNYVSYTNLKPGNYSFEVYGINSKGELSNSKLVNFTIKSPPWKTPIAYFIYFLIILSLLFIYWSKMKILRGIVDLRTIELRKKLDENRELYSKLLKYEKSKNNYFINLSHELRTPLNIILSTQTLVQKLNEDRKEISIDKLNNYMNIIKRNSKRLINLIDNIIITSKIEYGNYNLDIKNHDIISLVENVVMSLNDLAIESNVKLIIDPEVEEKMIKCDESEITRVIINLVSNAIKFNNYGGNVKVSIEDLNDKVKIVVKDTGIGINEEYKVYIFDRFRQEYCNTFESMGGNGLGLTVTRQLIELHKGNIAVKSEIGKGSEFIVTLPIEQ